MPATFRASAKRQWGNILPLPSGPILSENLYICCLGHAFGQVPPTESEGEPLYFVSDFLVDQSQSTGGGAFMVDPIQFDLTLSQGYVYQVMASCGKHIHVKLPPKVTASFAAFLGRVQIPPVSGFFDATGAQVSFQNLVGTLPTLTYSNFFLSHADNSALTFEIEGDITSSFQFDSLILRADFTRTIDPGAKWYAPLSYAVPIGTKDIYPASETFVLFSYQTKQSVDPGPFVIIA